MTAPRAIRYTADYLWETPDDGNRYEVIDGELFVTPPPGWAHQNAISELHTVVGGHVRQHQLGKFVPAPLGVVLDADNGLQPDLVYISRANMGIIQDRGVEGVPDMVVEVLSPSTQSRDRGVKMRRYARAGIRYYWIVAPHTRTLEAYQLVDHEYQQTGVYGEPDAFAPALFPGLTIRISDLFA